MAKSSKGKKALKAEQKAARQEQVAAAKTAAEPARAEKPKNEKPVAEAVQAEPVKPVSAVDRAINFIKANFSVYTVAIVLLAAFMFYVRNMTAPDVFTTWPGNYINVAADDGVYHMRLLYNTLQHFPFRILYDPFTHYPYGSMIHFGPLFELIPATFLFIVGLGHPSDQLIGTVAAYYPAVLGTLVVIPVYYIGKKLFGRFAGLMAAVVLACTPSTILFRSMVGIYDHHIAEVFFMACTVACLIYALDAAKESKLSFEQIRKKDYKALKAPLIYGALAGIFLGAYFLNWPGALLLAFTLFAYFTIQALLDYHNGRSIDYIPILAIPIFLIPTLMVLPYSLTNLSFQSVYYSLTQPVLLLAALAATGATYFISRTIKKNGMDRWTFPVAVVGLGIVGSLVLYILAPGLFGLVNYSISMLSPQGGFLTVQEAYPTILDRNTGQLSLDLLTSMFMLTFWTALFGLVGLVFMAIRGNRPGMTAFLVWNLIMTVALIVQNRFTYYYGVNAALLTACLLAGLLGLAGFDGLKKSFEKRVDSFESFQKFVKKNAGSCIIVAVVVLSIFYAAVYPATPLSDYTKQNQQGYLFEAARAGSVGLPYEWYDALTWMGNHTPDPQGSPVQANFDYASGQYYPPANYGSANYSYPASAYGVMSWWDYGHDIEYIAHRAPNANPFQAGIVEQNGTTGASPFFCATDENKSVQMLDQLGTRYVIIDNQMATGKFYAIQRWIGDTEGWEGVTTSPYVYLDGTSAYMGQENVPVYQDTDKWNRSIMNGLYYNDCDGMSHYRLVYESAGDYYVNMRFVDQSLGQGWWPPSESLRPPGGNLSTAEDIYGLYSNFTVASDSSATRYMYAARPPVKWVKIFEKVDGATLTGSAPDGANVTATLTLKTDWGRLFDYTITTVAHNGVYSLTVPYPTEQMQGDGYSYGIVPQGKYSITYGGNTKTVDVPESAVMNGAKIQVT